MTFGQKTGTRGAGRDISGRPYCIPGLRILLGRLLAFADLRFRNAPLCRYTKSARAEGIIA